MTAKPKRRIFRFSLRAMLVVLTVFGVWLGVQVNRANKQKRAMQWVKEIGGWAEYNWSFEDDDFGEYSDKTGPPGPTWLREQIGNEYFQSIVMVDAPKANVHDLTPLAQLPDLKWLDVRGTSVSDLSPLANLRMLKVLYLDGTQVSDISPLVRLAELNSIDLSATPVEDFSPLANLSSLEWVSLWGTQIDDLSPLANLTELKMLFLCHTAVADLSPLAKLSNLESLHLHRTQVDDLKPLGGLHSLKLLNVEGAPVTDEEVINLRKVLPRCRIENGRRDGPPACIYCRLLEEGGK